MKLKEIELGDILKQYRITHFVDNNNVYRQVTISKSGDVFFRGEKKGIEIGRKRQFIIDLEKYPNTCLFIRQGVQDGGIGIANNDVHNCIVTENMPMFSVENIDINFFKFLLKSDYFKNIVNSLIPTGAAQKAIHEKLLLKQKIKIPISINEQKEIVCILEKQEKEILELEKIGNKNLSYIKQLKQAILQEAIEGKLTSSWRENNPNIESSSILLYKIQKEKEELVKQKKLKKQEKLKEISQDEIPFEIPESWSWCRLGEICNIFGGNNFNKEDFNVLDGVKVVKITNVGVNNFVETNEYLPFGFDEKYSNFLLQQNDIVIALTRPFIKDGLKVCIVSKSYNNSLLNQRVAVIKNLFHIFNEYIYLFLKTKHVLKQYQDKFIGVSQQPNLKNSDVSELLFPLPPLEEQKEIVKKVDEMMKFCDLLEKQSLETKVNSENLMKSVLQGVFIR